MKAYGRVDVQTHVFLTSGLGDEWSATWQSRFTPGVQWIEDWVDPKAGLEDMEKRKLLTLPGLELRPLSPPDSSQSLY
jgi:hypothetical protein